MAISVQKNPHGPLWPLGNIVVPTPGTPVSIMSLVDPGQVNAPESATSATSAEYSVRAYAIIFQGFKPGAAPPRLAANTGVVYVVMKPIGAGGTNDTGSVIVAIRATDPPFVLTSAALNRNTFSPYEIFVDADTAGDGVQVTLEIQ